MFPPSSSPSGRAAPTSGRPTRRSSPRCDQPASSLRTSSGRASWIGRRSTWSASQSHGVGSALTTTARPDLGGDCRQADPQHARTLLRWGRRLRAPRASTPMAVRICPTRRAPSAGTATKTATTPAEPAGAGQGEGPATCITAGQGPNAWRRMGDSNPRGLSPKTLSKCLNGGWDVFARVRFRRSARSVDGSHDPWIGLDREELLPKLLPLRGRGTGGVEPGSRPALGQAVAALRPAESERKQLRS